MNSRSFKEFLRTVSDLGYNVPSSDVAIKMFLEAINRTGASDPVIFEAFQVFLGSENYGQKFTPSTFIPHINKFMIGTSHDAWLDLLRTFETFKANYPEQEYPEFSNPAAEKVAKYLQIKAADLESQSHNIEQLRIRFEKAFNDLTVTDHALRTELIQHRLPVVHQALGLSAPNQSKQLSAGGQ